MIISRDTHPPTLSPCSSTLYRLDRLHSRLWCICRMIYPPGKAQAIKYERGSIHEVSLPWSTALLKMKYHWFAWGKINDSLSGKHFFLSFPPATLSSLFLKGFFELTRCPSRAFNLALCIASGTKEVQRQHGVQVPGHRHEQPIQPLIVYRLKIALVVIDSKIGGPGALGPLS